jgi:hypothetical protein
MWTDHASMCQTLRALVCAAALATACGAGTADESGNTRSASDAGADNLGANTAEPSQPNGELSSKSATCEHPCEVAIAACIERADDVSLDASESFVGVVTAVGVAHSFERSSSQPAETEVHCLGQPITLDSLPTALLSDDQGREWLLGFAESTVPSDYFRVGQQLSVSYEDHPACIFFGHSRVLTIHDTGELTAFVMHDDKPNGLTIPGFDLSVGDPLCDDDGAVPSCGFARNSTAASAGDEVVENACGASIAGFTLTQTYDSFRAPPSPLCDGCVQYLVAGFRQP